MVNLVPQTLINFEIYLNGEREPSGVSSIDLPELAFMTTEISGAGLLGKYEVPLLGSTENLQSTLHCRTLRGDAVRLLRQKNAVRLAAYGAAQVYDAATGEVQVEPVRVDMRCLPQALNMGKFEPGEQTETEVVVTLDYLKITCRDEVAVEIDKFNYVYSVGGVDMLDDLRAALGR